MFRRAGLLSTSRTGMAHGYHAAGQQRGIAVITPAEQIKQRIEQLIFIELILGKYSAAGNQAALDAIASFSGQGADCVILGCTDFVHLLPALGQASLPMIYSTTVHARATARTALHGNVDLGVM